MQALGFVRDAAEVWGFGGRFVGRRFAAKGVWIFDVTLKRPLVAEERSRRTPTPTRDLDLAVSDRRAAVGLGV